jgi:hypothetical protein
MEEAGSSETLATIRLHSVTQKVILILDALLEFKEKWTEHFQRQLLGLMEQEWMLPAPDWRARLCVS